MLFAKRGHRKSTISGLRYRSSDERYIVAHQDQCDGVRLPAHRGQWLAICRTDWGESIISRHNKRSCAEAACRHHARRSTTTGAKR